MKLIALVVLFILFALTLSRADEKVEIVLRKWVKSRRANSKEDDISK